MGKDSLGI